MCDQFRAQKMLEEKVQQLMPARLVGEAVAHIDEMIAFAALNEQCEAQGDH